MKIRISMNETEDAFILTPIDFGLNEIRGLKVYVKNLNGGYINDGNVIVPTYNSDILDLYHQIIQLFTERLNCELKNDSDAGSLLKNAITEEKKFELFSARALEIRNNIVERSELIDFLEVIKSDNFERTLKPFQILAAYHLAFSQNACNFSVPGSGKTTTVLAAYAYLRMTTNENKKIDKLLIIGPLASFLAWKKEYFFCFGKKPQVLEITGSSSDKVIENALLRSEIKEDLILISYGSVSRRQDILISFLKNNSSMVVLDEAHRIKNVDEGKQSTATLELAPYAASRVVLTGTPAPNSYADLYNLYKFIWPSHNIIGYSVTQLLNMSKKDDDSRITDLVNRLAPFFIRIKKSDLDLPEPTFLPPISIELAPVQERIYFEIANMAIGKLEKSTSNWSSRLSAIIRLRQAACNPNLLNKGLQEEYVAAENTTSDIVFDNSLNVSEEVKRLIEEYKNIETPKKFIEASKIAKEMIAKGDKLIIWCEFIGTCEDLSEYFNSVGIENRILYGKTEFTERERIIDEFTDSDKSSEFQVIIANPHAVGESISLHATCHNALYLEQSFNAGVYMQSKDRIHRVGLEKNQSTNYYFIHSKDTIDETVFTRVNDKERRMLAIIENQEIPLIEENKDFMEDNEDDVKAIIRGYYEYRNKYI